MNMQFQGHARKLKTLDDINADYITKKIDVKIAPLPKTMQILLTDGGLIEHFKKHGGFKVA